MNIEPIRNDDDHANAMAEVERLWGSAVGTENGDKLDILVTLIEKYEESRWPINEPTWDPVDVLEYAISELGHSQAELGEILASRPRASEILKRQRGLSVEMIRSISEAWKIPSNLLIRPIREREKVA